MKKKNLVKILNTVIIAMVLILTCSSVFAATNVPINASELNGGDGVVRGSGTVKVVGNKIIGILQTIGVILSVIVLMVLGIKYMMGSAEEKAEYKKTMIPYVVGAALIFAASAFANVVYNFFVGIGL